MGRHIPLATSAQAVFTAAGVATATLAPTVFGSSWNVERIIISTTSALASKFTVYKNVISPAGQLDSTDSGNGDTDETSIDLQTLDTLYFVWSGGTPGARATVSIYGTMDTGRP